MATIKIHLYDSNRTFLEELTIDNSITKPDLFNHQQWYQGKIVKMRSYSEKFTTKLLQDNGHYSAYNIVQHQYIKRDGILTKVPHKIIIITQVEDDRLVPEVHISEEERYMRLLLSRLAPIFGRY